MTIEPIGAKLVWYEHEIFPKTAGDVHDGLAPLGGRDGCGHAFVRVAGYGIDIQRDVQQRSRREPNALPRQGAIGKAHLWSGLQSLRALSFGGRAGHA